MQEDPTSLRWHEWRPFNGPSKVVTLATNRNVLGSWGLYAITDINKLLALTSSGTRSATSTWWTFDGDVLDAVATYDANGNHQVITLMAPGVITTATEVHGAWSSWESLNNSDTSSGPTLVKLSVATSPVGYRCLCGVSANDGGVWATLESPNGWQAWQYLGGGATQVSVASGLENNTFVIVILGSNKYLQASAQSYEGTFTDWTPIATQVQSFNFPSVAPSGQVNALHFVDREGIVWTINQLTSTQWSSASVVAPSTRLAQVTTSPFPRRPLPLDGGSVYYSNQSVVQELFGLARNATVYRRVQNRFGTWSPWSLYATNVSQLVSGPKTGQVFIRNFEGIVYKMVESDEGMFVRRVPLGQVNVSKIELCYMPYSMTTLVFGLDGDSGLILEPDATITVGWPQWSHIPAAPMSCRDFSAASNVFFGVSVFCLTTTGVVYELAKDGSANSWSPSGWVALPTQYQAPEITNVPVLVQIEAVQATQVGLIARDASNKLWALLQRVDGSWLSFWYADMATGSSSQIAVKADWQGFINVYFTSADGLSFQEQKQTTPDSFDAGTQLPLSFEAFATTSDISGLNQLFFTQSSGLTSGFLKTAQGGWDPVVAFNDVNHFTKLVATESTQLPGSQELFVLLQNQTVYRLVRDFHGAWEPQWRLFASSVKQFFAGDASNLAIALDNQGIVYSLKGNGAVRQPLGIATMEKTIVSQSLLLAIDGTSYTLKEWTVRGDGTYTFEWKVVPGAVSCLDAAVTKDANAMAAVFCIDIANTNRILYSTTSYEVDGGWSGTWTPLGDSSSRTWRSVAATTIAGGALVVLAVDDTQGFVYKLQQTGVNGTWPSFWTLLLASPVSNLTGVTWPSGQVSGLALSTTTSVLVSFDLEPEDGDAASAMRVPEGAVAGFSVANDFNQQTQLFCVSASTALVTVTTLPMHVGSYSPVETLPSLGINVVAVFATDQLDITPTL
ncbi:hypothetical protein DYB28_002231 [Aphanomyces astaci]|uniref:Uncharacterized protein n=3 Tax=Aphanomyces astaci TaxID=112090 RepID=A0A397ENV6_APHAT|nr:hypothetical protein DYB31_004102 [Aphanomyces astaci]RHZ19422.1 hypothetical protein DYB26_007414 [Aphanomyces astaci]RLO12203.1 hypothetical protein DYB28_002231 [Aphanomyces astaci]